MNVPDHRPAMPYPEYRPPRLSPDRLLAFVESLPDPPPTHLPWLRRLLWLGADHCGRFHRLSCVLHDIGWRLP
jgi:hypothetical protein